MTKPMRLVARATPRERYSYVQGSTTPTREAHEVCPKWIGTGSVRHVSTRFWIALSSIQLDSLQSSSVPGLADDQSVLSALAAVCPLSLGSHRQGMGMDGHSLPHQRWQLGQRTLPNGRCQAKRPCAHTRRRDSGQH